jgi:8-oxo-dGTP pyrophosphatase MutT (NUDIX family)
MRTVSATHRPAVRVLCFDAAGRILLLHWRDPVSGRQLWEPPGGGIDAGETPLQTARRELLEETGLDPSAVRDECVTVQRDFTWNGTHFIGPEQFFTAAYAVDRPAVTRAGLLPYEEQTLLGHLWAGPAEIAALPDRVEPPGLAGVVAVLAPGTWPK